MVSVHWRLLLKSSVIIIYWATVSHENYLRINRFIVLLSEQRYYCFRDSQTRINRIPRNFRPRSVPANLCRSIESPDRIPPVRPGNYDTLSPEILAQLIDPSSGSSSYGDGHSVMDKIRKLGSTKYSNDENDSISGIDSTSDSERDSDYEAEMNQSVIPELNLRPEKLDHIYVPENKRSWKRFDFDADHVDIPPYEFKSPLPDAFGNLDLSQLVKLKQNWRDHIRHIPREECAAELFDRVVELEKLQQETEEWEVKRAVQISLKKNQVPLKRTPPIKPKDKRCCPGCLQLACVGDCPDKSVQLFCCDTCKQPYCTGTCRDIKYEQRMRQSRIDIDELPPTKVTNSRTCASCLRKNNSKFINANNVVLGRPKSCNSTYSRGQNSLKPKDMRPSRVETPVNSTLIKSLEKLGMEPYQQTKQVNSRIQRPRSRNSVFPSKSYFSQRKDSITEQETAGTKKKKLKQQKVKRPKTAG